MRDCEHADRPAWRCQAGSVVLIRSGRLRGLRGGLRAWLRVPAEPEPVEHEGDFWELISRAEETKAALLVRASRGSKRRVALASGDDAGLWEHVLGTDPVGARKIEVPASGGPNRRKGRTAKLTLRCTPVDLLPPKERAGEAPVRMTAVSALEEDPPRRPATGKKSEPLHWMLLATEGEAGLETARTVLRWYELRWRIEDFFHALKVGTRIEDRRLDEADDLKKCLAFERDHRVPGLGPLPPGCSPS